jgi:hypothetical protein
MARLILEVIGPKKKFRRSDYIKVIDRALEEEADKIEKLFHESFDGLHTTKGGRKYPLNPSIKRTKIKSIGYDREIVVGALTETLANNILSIINFGSGPRGWTVRPPKGPMRFQVGYKAATSARRALRPGSSSRSGKWVTTNTAGVRKPHRIDPRHIDKAIVKRRIGYFVRLMRGRIRKQARRHWR